MRDAGLRQLFQQHLPKYHWQAIETWSTGQGVPDSNYCHAGVDGWIEMKRVKGWRCKIEPEQIAWLERRIRAGGRAFLAARRVAAPQTFWLLYGNDARVVAVNGFRDYPNSLVTATGKPASWPWETIGDALTIWKYT